VREYAGDLRDKTVFDLFSGTGTIAQVLAPVAKQVIGVEIVEEAVAAARENAAHNGLTNCRFIAGDVFRVLDEIEEKPDVIVLDPPRDGIHPKALPKIIDYQVDTIVYISCKATSLARDLQMFQGRGYEVRRCVAVDQFCQTVHVEVVCLLSKLKSNYHIGVELEMSEVDLTAVESKANYEDVKNYVLEHIGL
jgi:tRNA/tmRNA/rRNA uracil-C5-methylase (TrmA/RlmC/RlmD family)